MTLGSLLQFLEELKLGHKTIFDAYSGTVRVCDIQVSSMSIYVSISGNGIRLIYNIPIYCAVWTKYMVEQEKNYWQIVEKVVGEFLVCKLSNWLLNLFHFYAKMWWYNVEIFHLEVIWKIFW